MDLDDQLAALAAGELDERDARALEARVAADPALARRLARIERLDGVLRSWTAPPMPADMAARLDARVAAALAALDDAPLDDGAVPTAIPLSARSGDDHEPVGGTGGSATGGPSGAVVDLAAARRRRGLPAWVASGAVAAAVLGVAAIGVGTLGDRDEPAIMADPAFDADDAQQDAAGATSESTAALPPADGDGPEMMAGDLGAATPVQEQLTLAAGDLEALADSEPVQQVLAAVVAPVAEAEEPPGPTDANDLTGLEESARSVDPARFGRLRLCADAALEAAPGATVALLGTGTYEGIDAIVVVLVLPADDDGYPVQVLAYDAGTCVVLDSVTTTRG